MSSTIQSFLVVGSGSIAQRHIRNLKALFPVASVACVSSSGRAITAAEVGADVVCHTMDEAYETGPEFAIVASPAPFHVSHAVALLEKNIPTFIEKPLATTVSDLSFHKVFLIENEKKIGIGYNLRFMPSAQALCRLLDEEVVGRILSISSTVGQYLPDWRPRTDYRKNVSAQKSLGGGVLLELSHEMDYLIWLFGEFEKVYCVSRNTGLLGIDVDDVADSILTRADGLTATVHLDFLQRYPQRTCTIIGELGTLMWNVLENEIIHMGPNGVREVVFTDPQYDRNQMYLEELKCYFQAIRGDEFPPITIHHGAKVLSLVDAMEKSAKTSELVNVEVW